MAATIQTKELSKRYGKHLAVDKLNLEIESGEVFGLLGPNGAGKTTTILMLLGLTDPTSGSVSVLDLDPRLRPLELKRQVGYLPDAVGFYDELTARENLRYTARLNGIPAAEAERRIGEVLERMGLAEVMNRRVGTYSHGMRQRLGLAELLLKHPKVIILDEPTLGLDPEAAHAFLQMIRDLKLGGMTVLLSSHLLPQVQEICDRVGLFYQGHLVLLGTVSELASKVLGGSWRIHLEAPPLAEEKQAGLKAALEALPGNPGVHQETHGWVLEADRDLRGAAVRAVLAGGGEVNGLRLETPSLDEIYTRYFQEMGQEMDHAA